MVPSIRRGSIIETFIAGEFRSKVKAEKEKPERLPLVDRPFSSGSPQSGRFRRREVQPEIRFYPQHFKKHYYTGHLRENSV